MQSGPGYLTTFLYYFVVTSFIVAFIINQGIDDPELTNLLGNPFQVGILFGVLAGGIGAYFNSHGVLELPIKNEARFFQQLNAVLAQRGYIEVEAMQVDGVKVYQRPLPGGFFAGNLYVQIDNNLAKISGRSTKVRSLRKQLETADPTSN